MEFGTQFLPWSKTIINLSIENVKMLDVKLVFIIQIPCLALALFSLDEKTERTALLRNGINHYTNTPKRPSELHTSTYHLENFLEEEKGS